MISAPLDWPERQCVPLERRPMDSPQAKEEMLPHRGMWRRCASQQNLRSMSLVGQLHPLPRRRSLSALPQ
jgi:hypothetical protein